MKSPVAIYFLVDGWPEQVTGEGVAFSAGPGYGFKTRNCSKRSRIADQNRRFLARWHNKNSLGASACQGRSDSEGRIRTSDLRVTSINPLKNVTFDGDSNYG
jgi:hypothetical protein